VLLNKIETVSTSPKSIVSRVAALTTAAATRIGLAASFSLNPLLKCLVITLKSRRAELIVIGGPPPPVRFKQTVIVSNRVNYLHG